MASLTTLGRLWSIADVRFLAGCMGILILLAGQLATGESPSPAPAAHFYVAAEGNDIWSGKLPAPTPDRTDGPFATLVRARDAIRQMREAARSANTLVLVRGGTYRLDKTALFSLEDSAAPGRTVTYGACPGETPVFTSAVPVQGWKPLDESPKGLSEAARGKVWVAPMPGGLEPFNTLFDGEGMLPRARTGALSHQRKLEDWRGLPEYHTSLPLPPEVADKVFAPPGAEIVAIGAAPWTLNIVPVASVDAASGMVQLGAPSTYALARPRFGFPAETIWVENTFAGLDSPGEWVLDWEAKRIYLWPRHGKPGDDIAAPRLIELLRVEGRVDHQAPADVPVRGLVFRGLTFTQGNRFKSAGLTGLGLQHDWERFDESTALVRFRGAEECVIEKCRFRNSGGAAIRLDLHCRHNRVVDNEISEIGGAGILLVGYGPGTKDVNRANEVSGNHIHHIGRLWWHAIGIWAWQSGQNRITNNHVHHVPYTAVAVTGRIGWQRAGTAECSRTVRWDEVAPKTGAEPWDERERFLHGRANLIEGNDIHDVLEVMHDGNGVYISGAGRDNIVRGNFIHDVSGGHAGEAIRCDDDQHETLIEMNFILRFGALGTGVAIKGRNHIINNVIACPPGRVVRGMISVEPDARKSTHAGARIQRNILYAVQPNQPFQYRAVIAGGAPPIITTIDADRNLYFNAADPHAADEYLTWARKHGREFHSVQADPLFEDISRGRLGLKPGSPALELGFEPVRSWKADLPGEPPASPGKGQP